MNIILIEKPIEMDTESEDGILKIGTIYQTIPKVRMGGYQPFFLVNKARSEFALMSVIQKCQVNGISTRKM